jgi:tRNA A58 N-methylase Trm61
MRFGLLCLLWALPALAQPTEEEKLLERMKFSEIAAALGAQEGSRIADLGAGEGAYSAALARVVGAPGRVYAVELNGEGVKRLQKRFAESRNVEVIQDTEDDPKLPQGALDAVLLVDTYH